MPQAYLVDTWKEKLLRPYRYGYADWISSGYSDTYSVFRNLFTLSTVALYSLFQASKSSGYSSVTATITKCRCF